MLEPDEPLCTFDQSVCRSAERGLLCTSDKLVFHNSRGPLLTSTRKPWRVADLNMVRGASKQRQADDRLRADAWQKTREAELEAVVNRSYDGMDIPEIRDLVTRASEVVAPFIAEFNRLFAEHYPAEFARATLSLSITPGGIHPMMREQVRRDAAKHIAARKAFMVANSSSYVTETMTEATKRTTDNPEVHEMLDRLAMPNRATPTLEPPGPAIGVLRKLLPNREEWGFAGYDGTASPLLPDESHKPKALGAPKEPEE